MRFLNPLDLDVGFVDLIVGFVGVANGFLGVTVGFLGVTIGFLMELNFSDGFGGFSIGFGKRCMRFGGVTPRLAVAVALNNHACIGYNIATVQSVLIVHTGYVFCRTLVTCRIRNKSIPLPRHKDSCNPIGLQHSCHAINSQLTKW